MGDAIGIFLGTVLGMGAIGAYGLYLHIDEKLHLEVYQAQRDEIAARQRQERVQREAAELYRENLRQNNPELLKVLRFKESGEVPEEFVQAAAARL